jgi:hypothetical protein
LCGYIKSDISIHDREEMMPGFCFRRGLTIVPPRLSHQLRLSCSGQVLSFMKTAKGGFIRVIMVYF